MWTMGFLLPHAPILVPEVAVRSRAQTRKTLEGLKSLGDSLQKLAPDFLLVLDPHAATDRTLTFVNAGRFMGDLGEFRARSISLSLPGAGEEGEALFTFLSPIFPSKLYSPAAHDLDYAAVVSLHLLRSVLDPIPPVILVNPVTLDYREAYELGRLLRQYRSKRKWGLLASGDLSHRLTRDAPSGFHPDGQLLDRTIVEALQVSSADPIFNLDAAAIRNAGECGLRSVLALIGLSLGEEIRLLSYEAPFGVGYASALFLCSGEEF
jgi:aromatic ring-opening dioxygenase LigB subunit